MLQIWLKINYFNEHSAYMKVWRQYEGLDYWLSEYYGDIYSEYLDLIKPARILGALLLGLKINEIVLENVDKLSILEFMDLSEDMEISFDDNIQLF